MEITGGPAGARLPTTGSASSVGPNRLGGSDQAAPADHVHDFGAALQRKRVASGANGLTTWTFDTPFVDNTGAPVTPIIGCLIESPSGGPLFQEPQITALSSTSVTLQLRAQNPTVSLSGLLTLSLGTAAIPANTFLHLSARNPSV